MVRYYFLLATSRLRRTPWLALLMVLSLGVGVAAGMTTITLRYVLGLDPIPGKSERLLNLQDPTAAHLGNAFSYTQAQALSRLGNRYADAVVSGEGITTSLSIVGHSQEISQGMGIRYSTREFFRVFNVPLADGRIWTRDEEESAAPVVVLEKDTATDLFHGSQVIGKQLRMGHTLYTVIGVTEKWNPRPRYYSLDNVGGAFGGGGDAMFMPVSAIRFAPDNLMVSRACPGRHFVLSNPSSLASSQCQWLNVWYLAHSRQEAQTLAHSLLSQLPRILPAARAQNMRLPSVRQILAHADIVPGSVLLYAKLGVAFLILCIVNASGMQLSRVLRYSSQIGIRRALGARRSQIIAQYLCDALLISGMGGALGVALTYTGLYAIRQLPDVMFADMAHMDGVMFTAMLALVLLCGLLVGVIPAWLASKADPALLIKLPQ